MIELLTLLLTNLFGSNLRPVAPNPAPFPVEPIALPVPPPSEPAKAKPQGPNIIVPVPAHADLHGPASSIARAMLAKGYRIFEKDDKPRNLNVVAIRTANPEFDRFRCRLVHFSKYQGEWEMDSWAWTTFPGKTYTVDRLLSPLGCAILAPGQYDGVYRLDLHRGVYQALCQRAGNVRVFRDKDRDREYDMVPSTIQTGRYGINVHATENPDDGISNPVADRIASASAGCLVAARVNDFVTARQQWRDARGQWGDAFTLTLLEESDLDDTGTVPKEDVPGQVSIPESWTPATPATTGTRNRNLLNVKQGADPWKYSTGKDSRGHTIFPDYASGLRAGIITLRTYWTKHKLRTLRGICGRWAPSSDTVGSIAGNARNQPDTYAAFLAERMGIRITDSLMTFNDDGSIRSADQLFQLVSGMAAMENHRGVIIPRELFDRAISLL